MKLQDLLLTCKEKGIQLRFENARIKYKGPKDKVTPELLSEIKRNKEGLIKYLWPLPDSYLIPLQPLGNKTPFFLVHGDSGSIYLARHMGLDQPFYCFLHPGSEGLGLQDLNTIEKITNRYIVELLSIKPNGPYRLGGFSIGGIIAFEMAVKLESMGHKVEFLSMFDSPTAKGQIEYNPNISFLKLLRHRVLSPPYRFFRKTLMRTICFIHLRIFKRPVPSKYRQPYISQFYQKELEKYIPKKFNGDLYYFKAEEILYTSQANIWRDYIKGDLHIFAMPGNHLSMLYDPVNAKVLSDKLGFCLENRFDKSETNSQDSSVRKSPLTKLSGTRNK